VTQDYTQALKDDNDAIGEHVRLQAAKALADSGAFDAARQLGIAQVTLTSAAMGNADALNSVSTAVDAAKGKITAMKAPTEGQSIAMTTAGTAAKGLNNAIDTVTGAVGSNIAAINRGKQANTDIAVATDAHSIAVQQLAARYGMSVSAYQAATGATKQQAASATAAAQAMFLEGDAAGLLKNALDKVNGKAISAAQAQNAFDSAIANSDKHVNAAGKTINRASASLDGFSSAAVQNRVELVSQVTSLEGVAEAMRNNGATTDATRKKMIDMRTQIINNAVAHGEDKDAVTRYIDSLLKIPAKIPPTKLEVDDAAAKAEIAAFNHLVAGITSQKSVQITTDYVNNHVDTGIPNTTNVAAGHKGARFQAAGGSVASYLASGGFPGGPRGTDTVPTWLTPGEFVMPVSAVKSVGVPALDHIRATGQLPTTGGGQPHITVYVTNPFTGEQVQAVVASTVSGAISGVNRDAKYRRAGV
jgi:hypothetical protein